MIMRQMIINNHKIFVWSVGYVGRKGAHIFIRCWIKTKVGVKMHRWSFTEVIVRQSATLLLSLSIWNCWFYHCCAGFPLIFSHFYEFLSGCLIPQWCLVSICSTLSPEAGSDSESSDSEDDLESPGHKVPNVGFEGSSPQGSPVKQAPVSTTASDSKMEVDSSDGVLLKSLCYHHSLPSGPNRST